MLSVVMLNAVVLSVAVPSKVFRLRDILIIKIYHYLVDKLNGYLQRYSCLKTIENYTF
jgi:hypothetical protein